LKKIEYRQTSLQARSVIRTALEPRASWLEEFKADLNTCRWWGSPFLSTAA
jgi:hypothetical protein